MIISKLIMCGIVPRQEYPDEIELNYVLKQKVLPDRNLYKFKRFCLHGSMQKIEMHIFAICTPHVS